MLRGIGTTRIWQIVMIGLFLICVAQAAYWIAEEALHSAATRRQLVAEHRAQAQAAEGMLGAGMTPEEIRSSLPYILVEDGRAIVDPARLEALDEARRRRLNRYGWEGSFFLLVLVTGMGILGHSLRQRAELIRRQDNFIAAVSHEFKSPLASLKLSAETLLLRPTGPAGIRRLADRMVQDTERLEGMVANTLDAARISDGRLTLVPEDLDVESELRGVLALLEWRASEHGVELELDIEPHLLARGDHAAFHAVLQNLLSNAVKSTARGGGHVAVRARSDGSRLCVEVTDDGLGFEPAEARRLFDKNVDHPNRIVFTDPIFQIFRK